MQMTRAARSRRSSDRSPSAPRMPNGAAAPSPTPPPNFPRRTIPRARSPRPTSASCGAAFACWPRRWAHAGRRRSPISSCCCSRAPTPRRRPSAATARRKPSPTPPMRWSQRSSAGPSASAELLQPRRLEQRGAVDRFDADPDGAAVAQQLDRDFSAGGAARPDLAIEIGEAGDALVAHRPDDIAGAHAGGGGRAALGEAGDDDLLVALGRVEADPRPRRLVALAVGEQLVEHRLQYVDRHDHVDVARAVALDHLLDIERADAEQLAVAADEPGAAPEGMRRRGEDRGVQQVFPVAREFLRADDAGAHRLAASAGGEDDA